MLTGTVSYSQTPYREVNAGKSLQLAFSWWKTYRKNLVSCNHYLFFLDCVVFTCQTWRFTVLYFNTCQCQMLRSGCELVLRQYRSCSCLVGFFLLLLRQLLLLDSACCFWVLPAAVLPVLVSSGSIWTCSHRVPHITHILHQAESRLRKGMEQPWLLLARDLSTCICIILYYRVLKSAGEQIAQFLLPTWPCGA